MNEPTFTDVDFKCLDLDPTLLRGVEDAGFHQCTPIQAKALPLALAGHDVEGQAQTGTGKTAAFLLASMNRVLRSAPPTRHRDGDPRIVILAPTRELAVQIHSDAEVLGRHTGLRLGLVFGGTGYESQRRMLEEGVDLLVGTPGRLIDYFKQKIFTLNSVQVAVLDEADRMFDLGFIRDIRYLLRRMPPPGERLNMLFSATLSMRVSELAFEHLNAPTVVDATPPDTVTVENVRQMVYHVANEEKIPLLLGLLERKDPRRTMVFVNTRRGAEMVSTYLETNGIESGLLTGDVPQGKRLALFERFKKGDLPVLVATDVAARGLHIPDVSHVFNFDLPQDAEDYVHRVGRTARVGASGDAVSFACETYVYSLPEIEEFIGRKIQVEQVSDELLVRPKPPARRPPRPRDGRGGPRGRGRSGGGDRGRRERGAKESPDEGAGSRKRRSGRGKRRSKKEAEVGTAD